MSLEKLKNLIPFLSLLVVFSSAVKLITYYKAFGINIVDYMELSEFTFSFLDDLYSYIIMLGGFMVWTVIDDIIYPNNRPIENEETLDKRRKLYRDLASALFLIYGLSTLASIWFINWIVYRVSALLIIIVYVIYSNHSQKTDKLSKYYLLIPTLLVFGYFNAKSEVNIIKETGKSLNVILIFDNKTVKTDTGNYYLGKTKNYTFFYNAKLKKSTIYSNNKISSIEITKYKK